MAQQIGSFGETIEAGRSGSVGAEGSIGVAGREFPLWAAVLVGGVALTGLGVALVLADEARMRGVKGTFRRWLEDRQERVEKFF